MVSPKALLHRLAWMISLMDGVLLRVSMVIGRSRGLLGAVDLAAGQRPRGLDQPALGADAAGQPELVYRVLGDYHVRRVDTRRQRADLLDHRVAQAVASGPGQDTMSLVRKWRNASARSTTP